MLGFFLSNIAKRSRPRELHPFIQYAASTTSTRASSLRERSAATNRRTSSVEKSLDLALFFIGNRPEALAQRDCGVRILETFFRRMVPRSLDRLTHHNLDAPPDAGCAGLGLRRRAVPSILALAQQLQLMAV